MAPDAVFVHDDALDRFAYPPDCPFKTCRAGETLRRLGSMGLLTGDGRRVVAPEPASREAMERLHTRAYLDVLEAASRGQWDHEALFMGLATPDCPVWLGMWDYARLAVGATLTGVRLVLDGEARVAFNPSGGYHHAFPSRAAGFCYVNDVALACDALARAGRRVLYLDVDVHHGDGVQSAFYDRRDVMTISLHQSGRTLFPGTGFEDEIGAGEGVGHSVNIPLPLETYDAAWWRAFETVVPPLVERFGPDVVVFELGADGLAGDPLAGLSLTNNVYADVVEYLLSLGTPVVATGGGGYHEENTVRAWALAWTVFTGQSRQTEDLAFGMGGVMLENTDWQGGLRDRVLPVTEDQRASVDPAIDATLGNLRHLVFPHHGL